MYWTRTFEELVPRVRSIGKSGFSSTWIFGFPIEHKIRKRISRRMLLMEILTRHGFPISESATKSVARFCVRLEIRRSRFYDLNPDFPIERTPSLDTTSNLVTSFYLFSGKLEYPNKIIRFNISIVRMKMNPCEEICRR